MRIHNALIRIKSSRPEVFCKKGFLKNFAKLTGRHLCQSLFVNKVAASGASDASGQQLY